MPPTIDTAPAAVDWIVPGRPLGAGSVAERLLQANGDPDIPRPFSNHKGENSYVTLLEPNGKLKTRLIGNAPATLRRDDWIMIDEAVMRSSKPQLRAFSDLRASGNVVTIPNGMGKTMMLYQTMGDITPATISMDALRQSEEDMPEFDTAQMPLPLIHKDFSYSLRQILVSRQSNTPLDTSTASLAGRRVSEEVEKLTLGITSFTFGGFSIYGYTNHPNRNSMVLTDPAAGGWTPSTLINEILQMKQKSLDDYHNGPWRMYLSPAWDLYFDDDYNPSNPSMTLRQRVQAIEGIQSITTLDFLTGKQILLVQMEPETARAVVGMDIRTVQWESQGGFRVHFKVLCLLLPQIRADASGQSGIVHGAVP
jgi:hypothetical protein